MKKTYTILIQEDPVNRGKEQFKVFQKDGKTIEVPMGRFVDVPEWVAVRAKEIGLISDYMVK